MISILTSDIRQLLKSVAPESVDRDAFFSTYVIFRRTSKEQIKHPFLSSQQFSGRANWNLTSGCVTHVLHAADFLKSRDADAQPPPTAGETYTMIFEGRDHGIITTVRVSWQHRDLIPRLAGSDGEGG